MKYRIFWWFVVALNASGALAQPTVRFADLEKQTRIQNQVDILYRQDLSLKNTAATLFNQCRISRYQLTRLRALFDDVYANQVINDSNFGQWIRKNENLQKYLEEMRSQVNRGSTNMCAE